MAAANAQLSPYPRLFVAAAVVGCFVAGSVPLQGRTTAQNPATTNASTECVRFKSPNRLPSGTDFRVPLPRGLEFKLKADRAWNFGWGLAVGLRGEETDYMWVVTPPFQTAPHLFLGASYGVTTRESVQFERNHWFVVTPEDYDRALRIFEDWSTGRTDAEMSRDRRAQLRTGTLRLTITNYRIGKRARIADAVEIDVLEWIEFEGEACVPRQTDELPVAGLTSVSTQHWSR